MLWNVLNVAVWSREELITAFMPVWQKIYFQEPEGILFRLPVDPVALGVPVSVCIYKVTVMVNFINSCYNRESQCR